LIVTLVRYLGAAVGARLADEGARVAILLLALERTGRAPLGGLLVAALMVPHVAAAPFAGNVADRARHRKGLYVAAFTAYALGLAGAALLVGRLTLVAAGALIVAGCVAPLLLGGLSSLLNELASSNLPRAFGLDATTYGVAGIAGPAVAAVVAGFAGAAWSMLALGGLVLLGAALLATLPLRAHEPTAAPRARPLAGVGVMVRRPRLGAMTATSGLNAFGIGALPLAAAAIAAQEHRPADTGLIMSVSAAGGLLGSLLCSRFPFATRYPERSVLGGTVAAGVAFLVAALVTADWLRLSLFALAGLSGGPIIVALFAIRDREAPGELRTQVFTLGGGVKVTAGAAGAAVGGLLAAQGASLLLAGIAACQLAGVAVGATWLRATTTRPWRVQPSEERG
jgi:MFS family permease